MKILLYSEAYNSIKKSGVGKALSHQMEALERNQVPYTLNPKDDYDLVHINTIGPKSYRMAKRAKKHGKKVIMHAHSTEEDFRNSFLFSNAVSGLFKKWLIRCYTAGDCIVTPTPYSKSLLERYGIDKEIFPISNGIDLDFFRYDAEQAADFRAKYGFSKEDKVIISVGLYIQRKGITDFVELAKRMPEYHFVWFGFTPLFFVPRKIGQAVRTKLPNLHFPGYIDSGQLRAAYWGSDLFFFPTHEETEGIVVLEALAAKQNVLIRDIPVYSGWLQNNQTIYKADSIDGFEQTIRQMMEGQLPSLVDAGYEVARSRSIDKIGVQLKEVYEHCLSQG